jgi:hypothetical protein
MTEDLTEAEQSAIFRALAQMSGRAGATALLCAVEDIKAAARREALLEGDARRRELSRNLERATELCRKAQAEALAGVERVARVEALAASAPWVPLRTDRAEVTRHVRMVKAADITAALAEPERDEEGR